MNKKTSNFIVAVFYLVGILLFFNVSVVKGMDFEETDESIEPLQPVLRSKPCLFIRDSQGRIRAVDYWSTTFPARRPATRRRTLSFIPLFNDEDKSLSTNLHSSSTGILHPEDDSQLAQTKLPNLVEDE